MLLGIIKDKTNNIEYYINSENNNISEISFTRVDNNSIKLLTRVEIRTLIKTLLSSKLTYKEKYNDYDVYLDEANNKRYFKNGIENLFMYLENNGLSAINYLDKINKKSKPKRYSLVVSTVVFEMILTSAVLIPFAGDIQIRERIDSSISSIIPITSNELVDLIQSSRYLTEEEKEILCNKNYFNFVLENSDSIRNYSLRKKFNEVNIKAFEEDKMENPDRYYDPLHPNTIYILEKNTKDSDSYAGIITHEFIHLTQYSSPYLYIIEATDEILKNEFYDEPIIAYSECVQRVKVLMEIIGPEPIIDCNFKGDSQSLKNSISQYLTPEETDELLYLFTTPANYINDENYDLEGLNKKIDIYLATMYYNKTGKSITESSISNIIYHGNSTGRIYFNSSHENYNNDFYVGNSLEFIQTLNINDVINSNNVKSYDYSIKIQQETSGDSLTPIRTKSTTNFSSISEEETPPTQIKINFNDGTVGYVNYDEETNNWGPVKQYNISSPYEPSIPKKFPDQIKNSINIKEIPEKVVSEAKYI